MSSQAKREAEKTIRRRIRAGLIRPNDTAAKDRIYRRASYAAKNAGRI